MPPFGAAVEYLNSVLSQRGPQAVPYDESVKWNVRDHVAELQKVFPTLTVKLSEYYDNEGRLLNILKAEGTIPIHYQGNKYNIPILIWLPERYPMSAPLVYVIPTANMIVRPGTYVNASGQVGTPLLRSWLFPSSNLVDAVLEMSQVFGSEPPLYSRPAGQAPQPQQHPPGTVHPPAGYPSTSGAAGPAPSAIYSTSAYPAISAPGSTPYTTPSAGNTPSPSPGPSYPDLGGGPGWGAASAGLRPPPPPSYGAGPGPSSSAAQPPPPPPPPGQPVPPGGFMGLGALLGHGMFGGHQEARPPPPPPPQPQQQPQQPPPPRKEDFEVHFRQIALDALTQQLRVAERSYAQHVEAETHKALELQSTLAERRAQLRASRDVLTKERMGTEQLVAELGSKTKALQGWLERNEPKAEKYDPDTMPVSSLVLPADELGRQGLETQAKDLALEDTILALDKLMQTGQVTLEVYLKQVRGLCRNQFFQRALGLKVAAAQQQAAARAGGPGGPPSAAGPGPGGAYQSRPYPMAHGDAWSHNVAPPPAYTTDMLRNPLVNGVGR